MTEFIADTARSVGFLSRLPVPNRFFEGHDGSISRAVRAFPLAGLVLALVPALILYLLLEFGADKLLSAMIVLALLTIVTGALHDDGLADAADGLGGGRDRDHALAIMKDSRTGSYGVASLILSFGLRAAAIAAIGRTEPSAAAALAVLAAAAVSRGLMIVHWRALPPARLSGVAAGVGLPEENARNVALATAALAAIVLLAPVFTLPHIIVAVAIACLAAFGFTRFVARKLGGHTGDTIGATQQLTEIAVLVTLALGA